MDDVTKREIFQRLDKLQSDVASIERHKLELTELMSTLHESLFTIAQGVTLEEAQKIATVGMTAIRTLLINQIIEKIERKTKAN